MTNEFGGKNKPFEWDQATTLYPCFSIVTILKSELKAVLVENRSGEGD